MAGRVVFVSERCPWPIDDGGQIRTYKVLERLAGRYTVTLLALAPPSPADVAPIRALGVEVLTFPRRDERWRLPLHAAASLVDRRPFPFNKSFSRDVLGALRRQLARGDVAALHLNHLDAAQYLDFLDARRVPSVVDTHNVMTTVYGRYVETASNLPLRAFLAAQSWKMRRYEPRLLRRASACIVCSDLERDRLRDWGVADPVVVPNGVDTARFEPGSTPRAPGPLRLVFTGALDYRPNHDGMEWFLREVQPVLVARLPEFQLAVVGRNPSASLRALADPRRVTFTGRVEDVRPHVSGADVFIAPLRVGGGTRLKILEAMAAGAPVVSTTVGAEGIDAEEGVHLVRADTPEAFAQAIAALAADPDQRAAMARAARELVVARYDWCAVTEPLLATYERLLQR